MDRFTLQPTSHMDSIFLTGNAFSPQVAIYNSLTDSSPVAFRSG